MKGKSSERLEAVLKDPTARKQLTDSLISGRDGKVSVGGKGYTVSSVVRRDAQSGKIMVQNACKKKP